MTEPSDPATPPTPISVHPDLWNLQASPAVLERSARSWRDLREAAASADRTVSQAAGRVIGDGWRGETADAYAEHRRKLTGGLEDAADEASTIADALEEVAHLLRINQDALDEQQEKLSEVSSSRGVEIVYHPEDSTQSELVQGAVEAAAEIRLHVAIQLLPMRRVLTDALSRFDEIADDWRPRSITMMNFNIGQGYGKNWLVPSRTEGTDHGDIPEIAQAIVAGDADVVTIQEIYEEEVDHLERELEALTGDEWTIHFGHASDKAYPSDGIIPRSISAPFGNAVAVRHGDGIESSRHVATHDLGAPGDEIDTPEGTIKDGEDRSAVEVEITLGGR